MKLTRITALVASVGLVLGIAGCASPATPSSEPIVIGSQAYYSNEIIAEAYAQVLENAGYTVDRQFSLGQRDVYVPAIEAGEISPRVDRVFVLSQAAQAAEHLMSDAQIGKIALEMP